MLGFEPKGRRCMSFNWRTTILATGCILAIGTCAARAQTPFVFYYPAPGNYATTQGTVNIPAAGYYFNVPLYAIAAPVYLAPAQGFAYSSFYYPPNSRSFSASENRPAQGFTYTRFYYPPGPVPRGGRSRRLRFKFTLSA
jgi:hypothetical protein